MNENKEANVDEKVQALKALPMEIAEAAKLKHGHATKGWAFLHWTALLVPNAKERGVVELLNGWLFYADQHQLRFGSKIGDDQILGAAWRDMGRAIRTLLNGETGRLDCGLLDTTIMQALAYAGFVEED